MNLETVGFAQKPAKLVSFLLDQRVPFFDWSFSCVCCVLYLLLMFKRYESAGVVLCCDAFSILFKYIYFQILMIFFYEEMAVIYTLYNTCGRAFAGEYQCGIRLYCLMQYILTKNNHILGNYPLKDVVITMK